MSSPSAQLQTPATGAAAEALRAAARSLFISRDTIDSTLASESGEGVAAITRMLEAELAHRAESKVARLRRQARFPVSKSLDGFDFSNVSFPQGWGLEEMRSLDFVGGSEDLVFHGESGRGKTHVAIALGIAATRAGMPVRFFEVAQLVRALSAARREGRLDDLLADVSKARLVILDEFGYMPIDVDGARLLYQVIADSYERRSLIFTTNVEFSKWGTVVSDDRLAVAIVDRVVHHGRLVEFGGPSHRLENALMLGRG